MPSTASLRYARSLLKRSASARESQRQAGGGGKELPAKASNSPTSGNPPLTLRLLMTKGVTTEAACLDKREIRHWIYPNEELWLPRGVGKVHVFERSLLIPNDAPIACLRRRRHFPHDPRAPEPRAYPGQERAG